MKHCGFVAILGKPNAGKSTLLNHLVGKKVSIVTPKVQTTRRQIHGIANWGDYQVVFIDTPGIFEAQKDFDKNLVKSAYKALSGVDYVVILIDATDPDIEFVNTILSKVNVPHSVVVNKIDLAKDSSLLNEYMGISALRGTYIEELKEKICAHIPESPWFYESHQITNINESLWSSEITREQAMMLLHQEIPYELYVITESYETENNAIVIHQSIVVSKDRYKPMVLGSKGSMIKRIGMNARKILEFELGCKVHLFLNVKVTEKWQLYAHRLRQIGVIS